MGKQSQRKGAAGEMELVTVLNKYGFNVKRGGSMNFGTVPDVYGLDGVHIECKRCEKLRLSEWMQQSIRDAERFNDGVPTVFHRRNRQGWYVTMRLDDWMKIYRGWSND